MKRFNGFCALFSILAAALVLFMFEPFPPEIKADYDRLRFAYKWVFDEQLVPTTASTN